MGLKIEQWSAHFSLAVALFVATQSNVFGETFTSAPADWIGSGNSGSGNSYGFSNTGNTTGSAGEAGGTLARAPGDLHYADTTLSSTFSLSNLITASGSFFFNSPGGDYGSGGDSEFYIGHLDSGTALGSFEFLGLEFRDDSASTLRWRPRLQEPNGGGGDGGFTSVAAGVAHTFSYTYDPNLGANGRMSVTVDATTTTFDLSGGERGSGAVFNAFGLGQSSASSSHNAVLDAAANVDFFMDNVTYSGDAGPPPPPPPAPVVVTPNAIRLETFNSAGAPNEFVEVNGTHSASNPTNDFGFSNTNNAGGTAGEAGGTFGRSTQHHTYSDTDLTVTPDGVFDRTKTMVLSGKAVITGSSNPDTTVFVGYSAGGLAVGDQQFIGLTILEPNPAGGPYRLRAVIQNEQFNAFPTHAVASAPITIAEDTPFTFDLIYSDTGVGDNGIAGDGIGHLFGTIAGTPVDLQASGILTALDLSANIFDRFGIGVGFNGSNDPNTLNVFFDDLTYSIQEVPEPSTFALVLVGMSGLVANARRKRRPTVIDLQVAQR